ncbi:MAG: GIY-YIG nuclease family protein [Parvibaculum sp.]
MIEDKIKQKARSLLMRRAEAVAQAKFGDVIECQFTAEQIRSGEAAKCVKPWLDKASGCQTKNPALYAISAGSDAAVKVIWNSFFGLPNATARGYQLPRRNSYRRGQLTLYVGSSKNIQNRLRQHLGEAPKSTYALNMQRWCPEFSDGVTVKVQFCLPDVSSECRQDIEDFLWETMQPIFGKKGRR